MNPVVPRHPSQLSSKGLVSRPRTTALAFVKRVRSRSSSADSDIEILEPPEPIVPLDKGKGRARAANDVQASAKHFRTDAPDNARRWTSGERNAVTNGAEEDQRAVGRPPKSRPRLEGTASASAVASSSATTLEPHKLEKSQSTSRLPSGAFIDRPEPEPSPRKLVAPSTDVSSRRSSRTSSTASTSATSLDGVPLSAGLGRARKTVAPPRRASAVVVPEDEDDDDEESWITQESREVREQKAQLARQHAQAKARPGGRRGKRREVTAAEEEYKEHFPLRIDGRTEADPEDSLATSCHVKEFTIRIDEFIIANFSTSFPATYDVVLTFHLTCPGLNPKLDLSTTRQFDTIKSFHEITTSIVFERSDNLSPRTFTRPDGQYEARYAPPPGASVVLLLDPTTLDPATLVSARFNLELLIQVEYGGSEWGFLRVPLPEGRRVGRESLSIENTDAVVQWRRVNGRVGAKKLTQEHGEFDALARMVRILDLSTRMHDPFPIARRMVQHDEPEPEITIPDLGPNRSIYHFLTRVPYTPGDPYEHSDEETPITTNFLTRRQDRELFSEDPPLEPKTQIVLRLHQRFCAINPYPPRPCDRELACWTHYARQVEKYDLRREVYRHLRLQKDLDLLTAVQQAHVVEAMDRRISEVQTRRKAKRVAA